METIDSVLAGFEHELRYVSVSSALAILNQRVPHRYTGIFELRDGQFLMRYIHDKQLQENSGFLKIVPLQESFCQVVLRDDGLRSDATAQDERLSYSPYKGVVNAYHGVPMQSADGRHAGTLCHFDVVERHITDEDYAIMRKAAVLLPAFVLGRI